MTSYKDFHRRSIEDREGFWTEQARLAERLFVRRYDPPLTSAPRTRYLDILAG